MICTRTWKHTMFLPISRYKSIPRALRSRAVSGGSRTQAITGSRVQANERTDIVVVVPLVAQVHDLAVLHVHPRGVNLARRGVFPAQRRDVSPAILLHPLIGAADGRIPRGDRGVEDGDLAVIRHDGRGGRGIALDKKGVTAASINHGNGVVSGVW